MKKKIGTGEIAKLLRTPVVLEAYLSSIISTHMMPHNHIYLGFSGSNILFQPLHVPGTPVVYVHMCKKNIDPHKIK